MMASVSPPAAGGPGKGRAVPSGLAAEAADPVDGPESFLAADQPSRAALALWLSCQAERCPPVGQTPSGLKRRP
eukprot:9090413-Alexandrium_andersonii.AAC.1